MTVEVRPLGVKCNLQCTYCYQQPQRDANNVSHTYDLDAIKAAVTREGSAFSIFGGEPLLVPLRDLIDLWSWGLAKFGRNGIQTNGTLISDEHIAAFIEYNVHVGISIDGPGDLNVARWHRSPEKTALSTQATCTAIERLCAIGRPPSLIITLHRANATADRLPTLLEWIRKLAERGVRSMRAHILEVDDPAVQSHYSLSDDENIAAFRALARLESTLGDSLRLDVFNDMRDMLRGQDAAATCVWRGCDPYTTSAVRGIEAHGQRSNCGLTNKDGIDYVKADRAGNERQLALYHTPQEHGGCRDCRFFLVCKGQCPGTSINGDWRNRSEHCGVWKALLSDVERDIVARGELPVTLRPDREILEERYIRACVHGKNLSIQALLQAAR